MPKAGKKWRTPDTENLFGVILSLRNLDETRRFLRDILTEAEILEFANRWKVARLLAVKVPYKEIEKQSGMSSTTIARIQKWLKKGEGGYRLMIARMAAKKR